MLPEKPPAFLLIEDDDAIARMLQDWLAQDFMATPIDVARTLEEALVLIMHPRHQIYLIILDLFLPDATACMNLITEIMGGMPSRCPPMPIVILTGVINAVCSRDVLLAGAQDYIMKDQTQLRSILRQSILASWARFQWIQGLVATIYAAGGVDCG
jgi:response regulator of citrate/malate metabolism